MKSFDDNDQANRREKCNVNEFSLDDLFEELNELPPVIFACNVHQDVFNVDAVRKKFEHVFQVFGQAEFIYLPSFRRVRINYERPHEAAQAKLQLHGTSFMDLEMKIFFAQSSMSEEATTSTSLVPPAPEKQFLISPPASPPVGWEPIEENKPAFNFDLVSTLVEMAPGQAHELHKGKDGAPSVVVHVCESTRTSDEAKLKIQQTKRPGT